MKCKIDSDNKEHPEGLVVRRKFVPLKFTIQRENQFLNAEAKLPFTTNKIIGVLTCSKVNSCTDEGIPTKYYTGITALEITDTRFLSLNDGVFYGENYPPDIVMNPSGNRWWYYIHPILDRLPVLIENGFFTPLEDPVTVEFKQEGQCTPGKYYLWSGRLPPEGSLRITFFPPD